MNIKSASIPERIISAVNDENYVSIYELIARKCYRNCETCTQFGDDINMHCVTCKNGY